MAKRDEIAQQGLIILDAKGSSAGPRTAWRSRGADPPSLRCTGPHRRGPARGRARRRGPARRALGPHRCGPREARGLTEAESRAWPRGTCASPAGTRRRRRTGRSMPDAEGVDFRSSRPTDPEMTHVRDEGPALGFGPALDETSAYLIGSVAVGVIMVEGPTADLQFSDAERTKVVAEVQEGLTGWARGIQAGVSFVYDIRPPVRLDRPEPRARRLRAARGALARPAMAKIGFAANFSGVREYVKTIRANNGTKWAYVAFFTKYPTHHFAYASKPRLVMQYANDGWGSTTSTACSRTRRATSSAAPTVRRERLLDDNEGRLPTRSTATARTERPRSPSASWPATPGRCAPTRPSTSAGAIPTGTGRSTPSTRSGTRIRWWISVGCAPCSRSSASCSASGRAAGWRGRRHRWHRGRCRGGGQPTRGRPGRAAEPGAHTGGDGPCREGGPSRGAALPGGAGTEAADRGGRHRQGPRAR